jgi:hypothetical protein
MRRPAVPAGLLEPLAPVTASLAIAPVSLALVSA